MVLVVVCCIVLVVPESKAHFFIWKLVVKAGLLCSVVGTGKRMGWEGMGFTPPPPSQQLWLHMTGRTGLWGTSGGV